MVELGWSRAGMGVCRAALGLGLEKENLGLS
jgi:hypothetical protein